MLFGVKPNFLRGQQKLFEDGLAGLTIELVRRHPETVLSRMRWKNSWRNKTKYGVVGEGVDLYHKGKRIGGVVRNCIMWRARIVVLDLDEIDYSIHPGLRPTSVIWVGRFRHRYQAKRAVESNLGLRTVAEIMDS